MSEENSSKVNFDAEYIIPLALIAILAQTYFNNVIIDVFYAVMVVLVAFMATMTAIMSGLFIMFKDKYMKVTFNSTTSTLMKQAWTYFSVFGMGSISVIISDYYNYTMMTYSMLCLLIAIAIFKTIFSYYGKYVEVDSVSNKVDGE